VVAQGVRVLSWRAANKRLLQPEKNAKPRPRLLLFAGTGRGNAGLALR
jgi:hypothetical protein